ncbi:MAG: Non-canonical purine NTP pyrophosphatase [Candidatus Anoxychlamydiales bacterium]|nr:Non-canonical purine NTP pyrophosphatase [Candidatus Anoxychlamydiales bacterium]
MNNFDEKKQNSFQLVIASKNVHKIREYKIILSSLLPNIDILSLIDFPNYIPPKETGKTFEENALIKAEHAAKELNKWTLGDDSGLVVPALKGEPGIFSARYAGENASDKDNRLKLLKNMEALNEKDRSAYFECCIALASPEELKKSCCAYVEGEITYKEIGGNGFGYDPIFKKHDYNKTFAQLEEALKNRVSHRRKAIDKILCAIERAIS